MDVYEAIKKRRDVRSWFSDKHIDNSSLGRILKAGNYAPSVGLSQPWNYILIRDIETRKKIKAVVEEKRMDFYNSLPDEKKIKFQNIKIEGILESDLNMAVTCDVSRKGPDILGRATMPEMSEYSVVLSIENMWLAARAEGIGMGWISFIDPDMVKKILGIPESIKLVGYLAVGYLSEDHDIPELEEKKWEKRLDVSNFVYMDKWGEKPDPETIDKLKNSWI
ncbi:nitroreductase [Ferroplasma acidiphilum]|jgi:5,6-dimethylbenzimidazole synthase|uniref:Nitroreductase n=1 Tax=Ferroplasma acidiphilum TaxID=74969 RepID=A0A1V0N586_9ARCH|nr:5,6-dimethylbenzimidazole synthase [Ferroplasma acidiphilum]ARD85264.1 nitroreductase [Ferroplasma acidiphilum]MCL4349596.1 5,6-dimethylbenzimidazole synthase [Candidatus Thermoplasmatota archaeon]